ncbi:MAG: type 4a pilus biogenesis protein PilO, partial [Thermoleophilaceae bacterium]|nr:type 4a pilus biogenesis protein PilO [Thermoleophilaceae bacterium]
MKLTARDRKIMIVAGALALVAVYWFLLLGPKRGEAADLKQELADAEDRKTQLSSQLTSLRASKTTFASDYSTIVRLGKAIPTKTDMPSLLVQLESAAEGTGIEFKSLTASEEGEAGAAPAAAPPPPAAPGGDAAPGGE